jgi:hypothetical protein
MFIENPKIIHDNLELLNTLGLPPSGDFMILWMSAGNVQLVQQPAAGASTSAPASIP